MKQLTHGSLFAGIGGFDLGFERAGFKTVWQVEIDPYCRAVLAKHFPEAERFEDVREVGKHNLAAVDVITGGFPCQDISDAGKRIGIDGPRSGLWQEMRRIIGELRPRIVVVENVAALLYGGIYRVLGDLAALGYDTEWDCIPACAVGAPHRRDRIWILAYPVRCNRSAEPGEQQSKWPSLSIGGSAATMAHSSGQRLQQREQTGQPQNAAQNQTRLESELERCSPVGYAADWWAIEPNVGRVANGIPRRVDRLRTLGNAVVPQIAQWIAERILEATCSAH